MRKKVFMKKVSELSTLLEGDEAEGNKLICDVGEVEVERVMQELQMLMSSDQFVLSHSKDRAGLTSLLPPGDGVAVGPRAGLSRLAGQSQHVSTCLTAHSNYLFRLSTRALKEGKARSLLRKGTRRKRGGRWRPPTPSPSSL